MSQHGHLVTKPVGDQAQVLMLAGEFDIANAPDLEEAVDHAIDGERPDVIVDLRGVRFLDSTMLRALLRSFRRVMAEGGNFALLRPTVKVWRVFVLTGLSQTFPTFPALPDALSSFRPRLAVVS